LEGFLKLRPPTFDYADDDPIAAEDWLREMEKKLDLTTCTDEECVGVTAHQLTGTARAWWDGYCETHDEVRGVLVSAAIYEKLLQMMCVSMFRPAWR
jgi:hypothetical protein